MTKIAPSAGVREGLRAFLRDMGGVEEGAQAPSELVRQATALLVQESLEAEQRDFIGRNRYERGERRGWRNGYEPGHLETAEGRIALALRWTDLDGNRVRVQRTLVRRAGLGWRIEEPKTPRSRRSIVLPDSTLQALKAHRVRQAEERLQAGELWEDNGLIFPAVNGMPMDQQNLVARHFKPTLKAAGLPLAFRMYDLRNSHATLLLAAGEHPKVVSERLGHASITLTLDTYSHVLPDMQQAAAEKLEGMLFSAGTQRTG